MATFLSVDGKQYNMPSDCSLSVGNSCETKERRMNDGSKTSYSIATYTKGGYNTYSLSFIISHIEYPDVFQELYKWEELVGKNCQLTYCNIPFGNVIISSISVALMTDASLGLVGFNLSLNLRDNIVITRKARKVNVRLI